MVGSGTRGCMCRFALCYAATLSVSGGFHLHFSGVEGTKHVAVLQ